MEPHSTSASYRHGSLPEIHCTELIGPNSVVSGLSPILHSMVGHVFLLTHTNCDLRPDGSLLVEYTFQLGPQLDWMELLRHQLEHDERIAQPPDA